MSELPLQLAIDTSHDSDSDEDIVNTCGPLLLGEDAAVPNHDNTSFETENIADLNDNSNNGEASAPFDIQINSPEDDLDATVAYDDVEALNESVTSAKEPIQQPGSSRASSRRKNDPQWMRSGDFILPTKRR